MRRYDDPVEVRKGPIEGLGAPVDGPEQFLWRGRLWQVREVVAHWVDTGALWTRRDREVWRVAAARGRAVCDENDPGSGVFDLVFSGAEDSWQLARTAD